MDKYGKRFIWTLVGVYVIVTLSVEAFGSYSTPSWRVGFWSTLFVAIVLGLILVVGERLLNLAHS